MMTLDMALRMVTALQSGKHLGYDWAGGNEAVQFFGPYPPADFAPDEGCGSAGPASPTGSPPVTAGEKHGVQPDTQRAISENRQHLEEAERMAAVGQLAAGVAHEMNNILSGISARAQIAQKFGTEEAYKELVEAALRLCERGAKIGRNLMSFARPGEPERAAIDMDEQLDAALSLLERELTSSRIETVRRRNTDDRLAFADPDQIQQVLVNVIINACHAMTGGGTLTISTAWEAAGSGPGRIIVRLTDTGSGISPEHLPHVFEPFFTTKAKEGERAGTGLGLSVSRGLVNANEGTITLESELGVGTTCTISLPACKKPECL